MSIFKPPEHKETSKFMGVCATISNKYGLDVFLLRVACVLLAIFTGFTFVLIYLILGIFATED
jgi:phage shock protein PspC (stress-responsive transcriptional regulator)